METVTAKEAARLLGISDKTFRSWLKKDKITGKIIYVDGLRQWAIPMSEIERILEEQRKTTGMPLESRVSELERRVEALEQSNRPRVPTTRKERVTPTTEAETSIADMPEGTVSLADYASLVDVDRRKLLDHVMRHKLEHIAVPTNRVGEFKRYFTPEQQGEVLRYLDENHIWHRG